MKVISQFSSILLLAALVSAKESNLRKANDSRVEQEAEPEVRTGRFRRHLQKNEDGMYRVFVHYKEDHDMMMQKYSTASGCNVEYDFEDSNLFVMTVDEDEMAALENDPNVDDVEDDPKRYMMVMPEDWEGEESYEEEEALSDAYTLEQLELEGEFDSSTLDSLSLGDLARPKKADARRRVQASQRGLYGLQLVQATLAWEYTRGAGKRVCVIDSGIDRNHRDFDFSVVNGYSIGSNLLWTQDGNGHGTHVAGTVAALDNNVDVVGVAPRASLFIVRVFDNNGRFAYSSGLIDAARRCVAGGADIINMSLGGGGGSRNEEAAFAQIARDGTIIVASAGNGGPNAGFSYPASYEGILSVAAVDRNERVTSFSQRNSRVDISGPGLSVLSTCTGGGTCSKSGTSMSAPHVAGVVALLWSFRPNASADTITRALLNSAKDLGTPNRDDTYGFGLAQTMRGLQELKGGPLTEEDKLDPGAEPPADDEGDGNNGSGENNDNRCNEGYTFFRIELRTGNGGWQTTWEINRLDGSTAVDAGPFYGASRDVVQEYCVQDTSCYDFVIRDRFANGLTGGGFYRLIFGTDVIRSGGDFGAIETTRFGKGCSSSVDLTVLIQTDRRPQDTIARLKDTTTDETIWYYTSGFRSSLRYRLSEDVDPTHCYEVSIQDRAGNGLCCDSGFGGFRVWMDGADQGLRQSFGSSATIYAGNCERRE